MRRSRFLPVFFTVLTIAFVIALVLRLRNDMREATIASSQPTVPPVTGSRLPVPSGTVANATSPPVIKHPAPVYPQVTADYRQPTTASRQPATVNRQRVPVPAPQPQAQAQPSLISRMIAPITKAIAPGAQPKPATPASSQTPQISSSQQSTGSSRNPDKPASNPNDPKDPNSDSTPPQLMSVQFSPPQIEDGQQTQVVILASDDISGVRGISGTISSPSGKALQGFATQREGDTNRYLATVTIAKNAEQGLWKISFINMSDNASNSVTLSYQQGTIPPSAVLRVVSSNSDNTPPTLKNVWADKRAIQGGEKDAIFVEADDDKSGVNLVSAVFRSPSKIARIGAGCQQKDGSVWQCELSVPTCIDCGDWQLEQITLQDKANNLATYRGDNPLVAATKVNISGSACDSTPPVLQSLALDTNDVVLSEHGAVITITIAASDDNCGVTGASGQFIGPGPGSGGFFPLAQAGDSGTWTGRITLDPRAAKGTWRINSIQLNDAGHNLKVYYASDPLLTNGLFHVR